MKQTNLMSFLHQVSYTAARVRSLLTDFGVERDVWFAPEPVAEPVTWLPKGLFSHTQESFKFQESQSNCYHWHSIFSHILLQQIGGLGPNVLQQKMEKERALMQQLQLKQVCSSSTACLFQIVTTAFTMQHVCCLCLCLLFLLNCEQWLIDALYFFVFIFHGAKGVLENL